MDAMIFVIFICIFAMFVLSGFDKIINHDANTKKLSRKIGSNSTSSILIWFAAALELLAPLIVLWWLITGTGQFEATIATFSLVIFTVIATFIFYGESTPSNKWPFWSNVTTTGALLLAASTIHNA
jgi:uncharacterized membrane protein YphA (DoxX/SURF4 family)